ncbi:hypothetical protein E2C01_093393 [Portunus trituberculatus]|uniref:Uncharacterized protein n=1 Tax=Portunus trituberculatus TaxID=210409 RepID=A0A5B7JUB2_PORTR|nr:hypothetical protein [Portunus trituberculatus]
MEASPARFCQVLPGPALVCRAAIPHSARLAFMARRHRIMHRFFISKPVGGERGAGGGIAMQSQVWKPADKITSLELA